MSSDQKFPAPTGGFAPSPILRTREQVELQLREAILSGVFGRGDKLPSETELAGRFSVSRTTVREALRALAFEGLIRKRPGAGGGSFVEAVNSDSLGASLSESMITILRLGSITYEEITGTRRTIEVPSAGSAADNRTAGDLARIAEVIELEKTVTVDDPSVSSLDVRFHTAVADASKNRVLSAFVSALHRVTHPVSYIKLNPRTGRETVQQHVAILAAIEAGDADRARVEMGRHLDYVETLERAPIEPQDLLRDRG